MQPAYLLPCPLYPKTGLHPAPDQSTLFLHTLFTIHINVILVSDSWSHPDRPRLVFAPQCGYSTLTLTFYECCPDPDWCCSWWQLVESKLVRLAANLISFCEENSAMFWVVSVCPNDCHHECNTNPKWGPAVPYVFIMCHRQVTTWRTVSTLAVDQFISWSWIKQSISFTSQ
jgi:hypothetical protein